MPCKVLEMKSPCQVLFGKIPEIQHLKMFGIVVYPFLGPYNSSKLQARSVQCVFMGYAMGYKGVSCYNMTIRKVILSEHVIHDALAFPYKMQSTTRATRSQQVQSMVQKPILVQMPILSVSHKPQRENNNSYQENVFASMSESSDATSSHASTSSPDSNFRSDSMSQFITIDTSFTCIKFTDIKHFFIVKF